jgi:hypothetical protein
MSLHHVGEKRRLVNHFETPAAEADTHARTLRGLLLAGATAHQSNLDES